MALDNAHRHGVAAGAETKRPDPPKWNRTFELPLLGSNQDSPDPESGVLPVTPRGSEVVTSLDDAMELRGIEPLTSAVRLQRSPS